MGDTAVRKSATLVIVLMAAILLLLAVTSMGRATLAASTSGHNGPVPAVIEAGTSNHLTITVNSAPTQSTPTKHSDEHDSSDGGDGGD